MFKKVIVIIMFILIATTVITFIFFNHFTLLSWTDVLFACSLIVTIIGSMMHIFQVGFFNPFIKNFRYFFKQINKAEQIADAVERKEPNKAKLAIDLQVRLPLILAGLILFFCSTIISFML